MFLDFLEKREETTDSITLTDEEKIFLKVFGIDSEQPAAAMREATYFTCIKQLSEAVAKTPLYLVQDTENGIRRATEERLNELLSLRPNPYMTAIDMWKAVEATRQHEGIKEVGKEIKALWNHDTSRPLGSTKTDTLRFNTADTTGLAYDIDLPNNTWGNDVKESVQRGDVDGSSFGFICQEDRWSKVVHEGEEIYKRSVVKAVLLEVSPCTFPAYDSSEISCRSFEKVKEEAKEEKRLEKLKMEARLMQLREENEKEF